MTRFPSVRWLTCSTALLLTCQQALAQDPGEQPDPQQAEGEQPDDDQPAQPVRMTDYVSIVKDKAQDESVYEFNYSSPESPALPLIGVEGDQIARVDSLRTFGISLGNSFGLGDEASAAAIDFSPFWAVAGDEVSLGEYRGPSATGSLTDFERILARSKVGLAFSTGDEATGQPSSFVVSFGVKLLDSSDRLLSTTFDECIKEKVSPLNQPILQAIAEGGGNDAGNAVIDIPQAQRAEVNKAIEGCSEVVGRAIAGAGFFDVGFAHRMNGDPGDVDNLSSAGTLLWATGGTGQLLGQKGKGGVRAVSHVRYTFDDSVFDESFVLQGERDSLQLVAGIESIPNPSKPERLRWSLQAGWTKQNAVLPMEVDRDFWRYQANFNFRLSDSFWLTGTVGRVFGDGVENDTKALIGFTFTPPNNSSIFD